MEANSENKLHWLNAEYVFLTAGFTNWKKASERFSSHETSKCHKEAFFAYDNLCLPPHRILVNASPKSINVRNRKKDSVF